MSDFEHAFDAFELLFRVSGKSMSLASRASSEDSIAIKIVHMSTGTKVTQFVATFLIPAYANQQEIP